MQEVVWVDHNTFFVIYTNEQGNDARIVQRPLKNPEQSIKYIALDDVAPIEKSRSLGYFGKSTFVPDNQKFYTHVIRNFGPNIRYAIIIASITSPDIRIVGHYQQERQKKENKENIDTDNVKKEACWATWTCPSYEHHFQHSRNNNSSSSPSSSTVRRRTDGNGTLFTATTEPIHPVGVMVDYSTTPSLFGKSFDSTTPILYYITNEGMIHAYAINRADKPFFTMYDGMVRVLSSLDKVPSPVATGTTTVAMEQQQRQQHAELLSSSASEKACSLLQSSNTNQQRVSSVSAAFIESEHPFADAVKYYEQEKTSLWIQPRHLPTFRSLGTKPNARIPPFSSSSSYIVTKPTFGETSMPGFRFGTTPRFGDRSPTRLGVPISVEPVSQNNHYKNGHYSLFDTNKNNTKKEMIERKTAAATTTILLDKTRGEKLLNVGNTGAAAAGAPTDGKPELFYNNNKTRKEVSCGDSFQQEGSSLDSTKTYNGSSPFSFVSSQNSTSPTVNSITDNNSNNNNNNNNNIEKEEEEEQQQNINSATDDLQSNFLINSGIQ